MPCSPRLSADELTDDDYVRYVILRASNRLWALADPEGAKNFIDEVSRTMPVPMTAAVSTPSSPCTGLRWASRQRRRNQRGKCRLASLPTVVGAEVAWAITGASADAGRFTDALDAADKGLHRCVPLPGCAADDAHHRRRARRGSAAVWPHRRRRAGGRAGASAGGRSPRSRTACSAPRLRAGPRSAQESSRTPVHSWVRSPMRCPMPARVTAGRIDIRSRERSRSHCSAQRSRRPRRLATLSSCVMRVGDSWTTSERLPRHGSPRPRATWTGRSPGRSRQPKLPAAMGNSARRCCACRPPPSSVTVRPDRDCANSRQSSKVVERDWRRDSPPLCRRRRCGRTGLGIRRL